MRSAGRVAELTGLNGAEAVIAVAMACTYPESRRRDSRSIFSPSVSRTTRRSPKRRRWPVVAQWLGRMPLPWTNIGSNPPRPRKK
jgi:hypothetical protein